MGQEFILNLIFKILGIWTEGALTFFVVVVVVVLVIGAVAAPAVVVGILGETRQKPIKKGIIGQLLNVNRAKVTHFQL